MKKICTKCKEEKEKVEFYKNKSRKDGLQNFCKNCNTIKVKEHYIQNKKYYKDKSKVRNKRVREEDRIFICAYLKEHPCIDCGESDLVVLDFDHVSGLKHFNVSKAVGGAFCLDTIKKEIEKCEVRCANCHRRKTSKQFGWYKNNPV